MNSLRECPNRIKDIHNPSYNQLKFVLKNDGMLLKYGGFDNVDLCMVLEKKKLILLIIL